MWQIRGNYNQPGTLNAFAELISLAGAGVGGHVFSLANGTQAWGGGVGGFGLGWPRVFPVGFD